MMDQLVDEPTFDIRSIIKLYIEPHGYSTHRLPDPIEAFLLNLDDTQYITNRQVWLARRVLARQLPWLPEWHDGKLPKSFKKLLGRSTKQAFLQIIADKYGWTCTLVPWDGSDIARPSATPALAWDRKIGISRVKNKYRAPIPSTITRANALTPEQLDFVSSATKLSFKELADHLCSKSMPHSEVDIRTRYVEVWTVFKRLDIKTPAYVSYKEDSPAVRKQLKAAVKKYRSLRP